MIGRFAILIGMPLWIGFTFGADLPVPRCVRNPDVTQDNIKDTICVSGWTKTVRPPASYTNKLKADQLHLPLRVRVSGRLRTNPKLKAWEEDHICAIENGGNPRDPRNLMPQKWTGPCNAHDKDRVENAAHRMICSGELTLEEGQAAQMDWRTFYRDNIDAAGCE